AWHIIQGWLPPLSQDNLVTINFSLRGLKKMQMGRRMKPLRPPITVQMLLALRLALHIRKSFDTCIWAMSLSAFWGMMRFGEGSVRSIKAFNDKLNLK
ncbi:hypothetical protein M422DRAFT_188431, partial [Sphaerobolus stellatus SS14]